MAPRRGSIKARAASIIRSPLATIHQGQLHDPTKEKDTSADQFNEKQDGLERVRSPSHSSGGHTTHSYSSHALLHDKESQRLVRSIPAWVHTKEDLGGHLIPGAVSFPTPDTAHVAHHNTTPSSRIEEKSPEGEEWIPPWPGASPQDSISRWKAYKSATSYPLLSPEGGQIVSEEWWRENGPDYDQPWLDGREDLDSEDAQMVYKHGIRRRAWYIRVERTILRSPIVPMIIRMTVMMFSIVALGLAASIHHLTDQMADGFGQRPSTDMAIIVDAVAIVYLLYITYDEYSGKPLGLRSARAKMRLIFLDLFFIVFDSANLSLAFTTLQQTECEYDGKGMDGPCAAGDNRRFQLVLKQQMALASMLFLALVAWLMTFSISITR